MRKTNFLILACVIAIALAAGFLIPVHQTPDIVELDKPIADLPAEKAPNVSFKDINGKNYTLATLNGHAIILNFWASWCAPCIVEMPQLLQLAKDNPDMRLILMSVDANKEALQGFFRKYNLSTTDNVIIVWDKDKRISKDVFGTIRYPESIIIDKNGFMTQKIAGAVDWRDKEILKNLQN